MGGSTIQLFAIGPQDFHLTGNPQITFFKSVFRRHTKFLKELKQITPEINDIELLCKKNPQISKAIFFNFFNKLCKRANSYS